MISKVSIIYDDEMVCAYIENDNKRTGLAACIYEGSTLGEIAQELLDLVACLNVPVTMSYAHEDDPT